MTFRAGKLVFSFDYFSAAILCICALSLPDKFPAALLCILLHESGHIFMIMHLGCDRINIKLRCMSIDINDPKSASRPYSEQAAISAAGPFVNLICIPVFLAVYALTGAEFFKLCSGVSAALCTFNLLPVLETDGGAIASAFLKKHTSERAADIVMYSLTAALLIPVCVFGFLVLLRSRNNFTLLLAAMAIIYSVMIRR